MVDINLQKDGDKDSGNIEIQIPVSRDSIRQILKQARVYVSLAIGTAIGTAFPNVVGWLERPEPPVSIPAAIIREEITQRPKNSSEERDQIVKRMEYLASTANKLMQSYNQVAQEYADKYSRLQEINAELGITDFTNRTTGVSAKNDPGANVVNMDK